MRYFPHPYFLSDDCITWEFQARETSARLNSTSNNGSSNTNSASVSATAVVSLSAAESTNDINEVRRALQEANERIKQQKAQIKKLQHEVDVERGHTTILRHDNQVLRQKNVNLRISGLKKEKGELMLQVEQEEEYLTQTLQKKLQQLQKEKIDMENALEQEQEYIVNRLQKQLEALRLEQSGGASAASSWHDKDFGLIGSSPINIAGGGRPHSMTFPNPSPTPSPTQKKWIPGHSPSSSSDHGPSHPMFDMVRAELVATKATLNELEREYMVKFRQCNRLKSEVLALRQELGLPIGSDLTMEESLPTILSSSTRGMSSNTPSRRNSRNSVTSLPRGGSISGAASGGVGGAGIVAGGLFSSSSSSYGMVPATPSNTPANPAPISSHHFAAHRSSLTPQHLQPTLQTLQPHDPLATSPILGTFPGAPLGHERGGTGGLGSHHHPPAPPSHHTNQHQHHSSSTATSGTNSMASSVGSLGSTSPLMSSSYSSTSSTALPSIVPERQSLYRSKSGSSRQLGHYPNFMNNSPQTTPYQAYHSHHHPSYHHGYPTTAAAAAAASQQYHHHRQSWSSSTTNSHQLLPMGQQSANTSSSSVASAGQQQPSQSLQQSASQQQVSPSIPHQQQQSTPSPTTAEAQPTTKAEAVA
ncbi:hypothetical protein BGZ73_004459 [Actinomortierella ambigua]|nr:hypothetical protein BGZ73_004459 [Actinomortierella ambigua]